MCVCVCVGGGGGGGGSAGNIIATKLILFNLICNMTMF